jgi:hypothetical protein
MKFRLLFFLLNIVFVINLIAQKPNNTLPVELVYFNGNVEGNTIQLFWGTATEINNFGFNIQRSVDSLNWDVIGFVFGHGTSFSPKDYNFTDTTIVESNTYHYRLQQIDNDGKYEYSEVLTFSITITSLDLEDYIPIEFSLSQNYPNPFGEAIPSGNPTTKIRYTISNNVIPVSSSDEDRNLTDFSSQAPRNDNTFVSLKIYNILGKEIRTLVNEQKSPGTYEIAFNGDGLSSGIYFYKLTYGNKSITKKMNLIK